jgi:hypothetical protein
VLNKYNECSVIIIFHFSNEVLAMYVCMYVRGGP